MTVEFNKKINFETWKLRIESYELIIDEMKKIIDTDNFNDFIPLIKKTIPETNSAAQEKALDVVQYFCSNSNLVNKVIGDIAPLLINKYLSSVKSKIIDKTEEIMMIFVENEKHEFVLNEFIKGMNLKNPKIVTNCLSILKNIINNFGTNIFQLKDLLKVIPKLLEDRDKSIRDCTKQLLIELYSWLGKSSLESTLDKLKPIQITELTVEFNKISQTKPKMKRYLKSQKAKFEANDKKISKTIKAKESAIKLNKSDDLIESYEVLNAIPNDFYKRINEPKWTERKEALDSLELLTNHPKLNNGDYSNLVKILLKIIGKDSNITLVVKAVTILSQLCFALKSSFSMHSVAIIDLCLDKFKVTKTNVVSSLRKCVDNAFLGTSIDVLSNSLIPHLIHKTPSVRVETALFISRMLSSRTIPTTINNNIRDLILAVVRQSEDSNPSVRDAIYQVLAQVMYIWYDQSKFVHNSINDLDELRLNKIKACKEKYIIELQTIQSELNKKQNDSVEQMEEEEDTINELEMIPQLKASTTESKSSFRSRTAARATYTTLTHVLNTSGTAAKLPGTPSKINNNFINVSATQINQPIQNFMEIDKQEYNQSDMDIDDTCELSAYHKTVQSNNRESKNQSPVDVANVCKDIQSKENKDNSLYNNIDIYAPLKTQYDTILQNVKEQESQIEEASLLNRDFKIRSDLLHSIKQRNNLVCSILNIRNQFAKQSLLTLYSIIEDFSIIPIQYYPLLFTVLCDQLCYCINQFNNSAVDLLDKLFTNIIYLIYMLLSTNQFSHASNELMLCLCVFYKFNTSASNHKSITLLPSYVILRNQMHSLSVQFLYPTLMEYFDEEILLQFIAGIIIDGESISRTKPLVVEQQIQLKITELYQSFLKTIVD